MPILTKRIATTMSITNPTARMRVSRPRMSSPAPTVSSSTTTQPKNIGRGTPSCFKKPPKPAGPFIGPLGLSLGQPWAIMTIPSARRRITRPQALNGAKMVSNMVSSSSVRANSVYPSGHAPVVRPQIGAVGHLNPLHLAKDLQGFRVYWTLAKSDLSMEHLLRSIANGRATGSNRRISHAHPYCTSRGTLMYLPRPTGLDALATTATAYPHDRRCAIGLRDAQDGGRPAAAVRQRPRCLEYGRLLVHQSLDCPGSPPTARRLSGALGHPAGRTGGCSTRHLRQPRRLAGRQTQGHPPSRRRRLALRSCREYQTQTPLQTWIVLPGLHRRGWDDSGDLRPAAVSPCGHGAADQPAAVRRPTDSVRAALLDPW